jgi:hypothetical protein
VQSASPGAENQRNLEVAMANILNKIACKHNKGMFDNAVASAYP